MRRILAVLIAACILAVHAPGRLAAQVALGPSGPPLQAEIDPAAIPPDLRFLTPAEQAWLSAREAEVFRLLDAGDFAAVRQIASEILQVEQVTYGPNHPYTAGSYHVMAQTSRAAENWSEAAELGQFAFNVLSARLGLEHSFTITVAHELTGDLVTLGRFAEAEAIIRPVLSYYERAYGLGSDPAIDAFSLLSVIQEGLQDHQGAADSYATLYQIHLELTGPDTPPALSSLNGYAVALTGLDELDDALEIFAHLSERGEVIYGPDHSDTHLWLTNYAAVAEMLGRIDEAERANRRVYDSIRRTDGPGTERAVQALEFMAEFLTSHGRSGAAKILRDQAAAQMPPDAGGRISGSSLEGIRAASVAGYQQWQAGDLENAEILLRQAYGGALSALGSQDPETITIQHYLGRVLMDLGRIGEAIEAHSATFANAGQVFGSSDLQTVEIRQALAEALVEDGQWPAAIGHLEKVLSAREAELGPENDHTLTTRHSYALVLNKLGRNQEAVAQGQMALEGRRRVLGADHADTLQSQFNLGAANFDLGEMDRALELIEDVRERYATVYGAAHTRTVSVEASLASLLYEMGRREEAQDRLAKAYDALLAAGGKGSAEAVNIQVNLGNMAQLQGDYEKALALFSGALGDARVLFGETHPETLYVRREMANTLGRTDQQAAVRELQEIYALSAGTLGAQNPETLSAANLLAQFLGDLGRREEALAILEPMLAGLEQSHGPDHPDTLVVLQNLAAIANDARQYERSARLLKRLQAAYENRFGPDHPKALEAAASRGAVLVSLERFDEAVSILRQAVEQQDALRGPSHPRTVEARENLGFALLSDGQMAEAEVVLLAALDAGAAARGDTYALYNLALARYAQGKFEAALDPARGVLEAAIEDSRRHGSATALTRDAIAVDLEAAGSLFATIAFAAIAESEEERHDLIEESFMAAQLTISGGASAGIARSVVRRLAERLEVRDAALRWENAQSRRDALDLSFAEMLTRGEGKGAADAGALTRLNQEIALAEAEIEEAIPGFQLLLGGVPIPIAALMGAEGFQPLLNEDEALVLLVPGWTRTPGMIWAFSRERWAVSEVPLTGPELEQSIADIRTGLQGSGRTRGAFFDEEDPPAADSFDRAAAHEFYHALFGAAPVAEVLADKKIWSIVPSGPFLSLPFSVLVTRPPEGADDDPDALRGTGWLGIERSLVIAPSVAALTQSSGQGGISGTAAGFIGFGDPIFDLERAAEQTAAAGITTLPEPDQLYDRGVASAEGLRTLSRLPGTRREAETVAASLGAPPDALFLDVRANEAELFALNDSGRLEQARVLLFATHGLVSGSFTRLSEPALALTPPSEPRAMPTKTGEALPVDQLDTASLRGARIYDGLLKASEIASLRLDADWVILSACDTAAGSSGAARGLSGLARAFFFAGARSLVVSHWRVRDDVAARLTVSMVEEMATADTRAVTALRRAMESVLMDASKDASGRSLAHPAAWAPFQYVGVP